jgi:glutathione S-transferase
MRLRDPRTLHVLALYALPICVAAAHWSLRATLLLVLLIALSSLTARLLAMRRAVRLKVPALRLHTITFSHYVEKVRWSLDRLGVQYEEVPNIGIAGVLLTGRTVPWLEVAPGQVRIGESSQILRYLWGEFAGRVAAERTWFLEPTPAALELEASFDRRLGNDVRVWVYGYVLRDRALTLRTWGFEERSIPRWQRGLLFVATPLLAFAVRRMLGVTDARAARALERTREAFDQVDRLLADGRRYLAGESLTFADIAFASLGALAVLPAEYPGARLTGRRVRLEDVASEPWRREIEQFRARPAGQFILRLYRDERAVQPA